MVYIYKEQYFYGIQESESKIQLITEIREKALQFGFECKKLQFDDYFADTFFKIVDKSQVKEIQIPLENFLGRYQVKYKDYFFDVRGENKEMFFLHTKHYYISQLYKMNPDFYHENFYLWVFKNEVIPIDQIKDDRLVYVFDYTRDNEGNKVTQDSIGYLLNENEEKYLICFPGSDYENNEEFDTDINNKVHLMLKITNHYRLLWVLKSEVLIYKNNKEPLRF